MNPNDIKASEPETVTVLAEDYLKMVAIQKIIDAYVVFRDGIPLAAVSPHDSLESTVGKRILALFVEGRP